MRLIDLDIPAIRPDNARARCRWQAFMFQTMLIIGISLLGGLALMA